MPGVSGVTVVTMLVCFFICTRGCGRYPGARHSLLPLSSEEGRWQQNSRDSRGEIAKPWLFEI
jgi:hypothetical protein